ncbi:MAG: PilT/PilU family type 4a pilus ATPase [Candidatus Omnitrophica bacterium]|nr:PilT/PilU family type 4a pilus ATPase [Candidatus Omnitrophota bacterium]
MSESLESERPLRIKQYLDLAVHRGASDIHFVSGRAPILRLQGELIPFNEFAPLTHEELKEVIFEMLNDRQKKIFEETYEIDYSYRGLKQYYFRINVHMDKGSIGATIRIMPGLTTSLESLGLPEVVKDLTRRRSGLILLVGRAGMGKTTTMTHMVQQINEERAAKIVTVEDPIEFVYEAKRSVIVQREVGIDTLTFAAGLKYALRQDPDVVVIGEMRDLESISMALTTAETGHLVFGTLHSSDAIEAINRIIDVYPGEKQNQIRVQLAENLLAVIGQQLLPRKQSDKRILATEVVISTLAIRNMIRRNSLAEIRGQMETGREGMFTTEQCLSALVKRGLITEEVALSHAKYPQMLDLRPPLKSS